MKIYLPTVGVPPEISAVRDFERLAQMDRFAQHSLVTDPRSADVFLFTECHQLDDPITLTRIRRSVEFRTQPEKCFVFDQRPRSYCSLPGLYTSVPWRSLHRPYQVPWSYHTIESAPTDHERTPDLLFSFVGTARSHSSRELILELTHPRAIVKQVDGHVNWHPSAPGYDERRREFAEVLERSSFVLCPRGRATSSFRFYEAMAAGRVPVVLADDWIPPWGVNIAEFAVLWPENSVEGLVEYLERHEGRAQEMGRRAREVFEERFAPDVMFHNIGEALEELAATRPWNTFPRFGYPPDRRVVRHLAGSARKRVKRLLP